MLPKHKATQGQTGVGPVPHQMPPKSVVLGLLSHLGNQLTTATASHLLASRGHKRHHYGLAKAGVKLQTFVEPQMQQG